MANERYKHLSDIVQETFILGCPVAIEKGALLSDTVNNTTILRLRLKNASKKSIKFLSISAYMYDDANDSLIKSKFQEFAYLDLAVKPQDSFGDNQANILLDPNTRKVKIIFNKVVFSNEEVWRNDSQEIGVNFPDQESIEKIGPDLLSQCKREFELSGMSGVSSQNIKFIPILQDEYWQCSCCFPNNNEDKTCLYCGINKEWIFKNTDIIGLTQKLKEYNKKQAELSEKQQIENTRLAQEKKIQEELQKEKEERRKIKIKKYSKIIVPIVSAMAIILIIVNMIIIPEMKNSEDYTKAIALVSQEKYLEAKSIFTTLDDYKDTKNYLTQINAKFPKKIVSENYKSNIIVTGDQTIVLKSDGTVDAIGSNNYGQCDVRGWTDIIAISASETTTYGLRWDGTVVSTGLNTGGENWIDIVAISTDNGYTVGLKNDGTVVAVGDNLYGQCNVSDWSNIVAIFTAVDYTVGLKNDGTVVAVGFNTAGQCNVSDWSDIIAISSHFSRTVGLKKDGTVVKTGKIDVSIFNWTDIVAISSGVSNTIVGLKKDGTVVTTDKDYDSVLKWTDIVAISTGAGDTIVGLKKDGTVVSVGRNEFEQTNVGKWRDVIAIATGGYNTIGLRSDGTIIVAGKNNFGQCDVSTISNISVPLK